MDFQLLQMRRFMSLESQSENEVKDVSKATRENAQDLAMDYGSQSTSEKLAEFMEIMLPLTAEILSLRLEVRAVTKGIRDAMKLQMTEGREGLARIMGGHLRPLVQGGINDIIEAAEVVDMYGRATKSWSRS
ncbi:hypothetical protein H2200_005844 [Cladophialophora chaetospira]|uniref:Uncharacterized protein n=1 Tax=Cladophialophora chaetospira TaxID=386627 RepID=A0AA38X9U2_9EURO|nr:hypothetical protein H2200_005844 [Cladophialophora chaetospira]